MKENPCTRRSAAWRIVLTTFLVLASTSSLLAQERRQIAQGRSGRLHDYIDAGVSHTLLVSGGRVWAWGANNQGQLGAPGAGPLGAAPVRVDQSGGLAGIIAVVAGAEHSVALDSTGHVWTWGDNARG